MKKLKSLLVSAIFLAGCAANKAYLAPRNIALENKVYSVNQNIVKEESENGSIKFGVVADIHNKIEKAEKIAQKFQEEEVDSIIVAGDMAKTLPNLINLQEKKQIKDCLVPFLEIGKPIYVIAGNHETKVNYFKIMQNLAEKYNNLFDLATLKYVDLQGVNIFGVSGGSPSPIGGFSVRQEVSSIDDTVFNLDNDPVLMISHMPPKFNHKNAIDCVYDVKTKEGKIIKSRHKWEKLIYRGEKVRKINPRNRGRKELTDLVKEKEIKFSVSGHYHMNQGANNFEKNIPENKFVEQLFMNPGACQYDMAGILTIKDNKVKYELLKIN